MAYSIHNVDRATHLEIVILALLLATAVSCFGLNPSSHFESWRAHADGYGRSRAYRDRQSVLQSYYPLKVEASHEKESRIHGHHRHV